MLPAFPSDLWFGVLQVGQLRKRQLIEVSCVSRELCRVALPFLFRCLSLRIGLVERKGRPIIDGYSEDEIERVRKSVRVLQKLAQETADSEEFCFAHLVQELRITGVTYDIPNEQRALIVSALKMMPNLQHFVWHGEDLPITLASDLSPFNLLLSLNTSDPGNAGLRAMKLFSRIRSLELSMEDSTLFPLDPSSHVSLDDDLLGKGLETNRDHLVELSLYEEIFRKCFELGNLAGIAAKLTHFAIRESPDTPGLQVFLLEAISLESLALLNFQSLDCLPSTPGALPKLRYLKIAIGQTLTIDEEGLVGLVVHMEGIAEGLFEFLRSHSQLRGFDFSTWLHWNEHEWDSVSYNDINGDTTQNAHWFEIIVEAVNSLTNLCALGITVPLMDSPDMTRLLEKLLDREESRSTCLALRIGGLSDVPLDIWTTEFRNGAFISLSSDRPLANVIEPRPPKYPAPSVERLVSLHCRCPLKQFNLNGMMYDVTVPDADEQEVVAKPWSRDRMDLRRNESDFYSFEAYWLMRYRTVREGFESIHVYTGW